MTLDVGFGIEVLETIRLRGIDAPENYGRWLGDVWYLEGGRDGRKIAARGQLLNRDLPARGRRG